MKTKTPLVFLLALAISQAEITVVGTPQTVQNNGSDTILDLASISHSAGNALAVFTRYQSTTATVTCSNTAGDTWTTHTYESAASEFRSVWCTASSSAGHGSDVIRVTYSASVSFRAASSYEIAGAATSSMVDVNVARNISTDPATPCVSASVTTSQADEIILMGCGMGGVSFTCTADTNYTLGTTDPNGTSCTQYRIVSATQSGVTPDIDLSSGGTNWTANTISLKGAVAAAPPRRRIIIFN